MTARFLQRLRTSSSAGFVLFGFVLLIALGLRLGSLSYFRADLNADPDAYLTIARGVAEGQGYSVPGSTTPTAFRPPLYPLLLTLCSGPDQQFARGALQLLLSLATLPVVWLCGRQLGLTLPARLFAVSLLAVDPLLLRYLPYPMTETLCAFLISVLLLCLTRPGPATLLSRFFTGLAFGACVLSRPTFWAFGMLYIAGWFVATFVIGRKKSASGFHVRKSWQLGLACAAGIAVFVAPWVVRNAIQIGTPILMTTHGGYTLLLGNNTAFYQEVVRQPFGTVWDGSRGPGQAVWLEGVQHDMAAAGATSEVEQDRYLSQLAWKTIRENPRLFVEACWLKFLWFWNIAPHASTAQSIPPVIRTAVAIWYGLLWCCLMIGLLKRIRYFFSNDPLSVGWRAPILLVLAMSAAHLLYWSDARMRAPLMPAIVLLAAAAWPTQRRVDPGDDSSSKSDFH